MGRKNFYIARIEVDKKKTDSTIEKQQNLSTEEKKFQSEHFVSPYHGTKVKDVSSFPYVKFGNRSYDSFRSNRLQSDEELEKIYGTKYYEFTQIQGVKRNENPSVNNEISIDKETVKEVKFTIDGRKEVKEEVKEIKKEIINNNIVDDEYDFNASCYPNTKTNEDRDFENYEYTNPKVKEVEPKPTPTSQPKSSPTFVRKKVNYVRPPLDFLLRSEGNQRTDYTGVNYQKEIIDRTLKDFKIGGRVVHFIKGPTVTQFEVKLDAGVRVEKIKSIQKNLQMNLEGKSIRIEAPIPGKSTVGIEVPNQVQEKVLLGDLISKDGFLNDGHPLNVAIGIDISGNPVYLDITEMPHALIAGTTGSGKSVCLNTILTNIIYKASPDEVRLILIDPKLIEFSAYDGIPHLATPVINDPKLATTALKWAIEEMQNRYELFKVYKRRDIASFNEFASTRSDLKKLPYIVIVIDELAELMFVAASSVEEYIQRIAQKARAAGIHLIMATQRPSTDVIKGTIKANIQTRIAFAVNSQVDSMTILDKSGAEKLIGKGDMLYVDGVNEVRVQGAYISLDEIIQITDYVREANASDFLFSEEDLKQRMEFEERYDEDIRNDEYFPIIARNVVENNNASINRIQKEFGIGFNRAQAIMNELEKLGVVSSTVSGKQRTVLVTLDELDEILDENLRW